MNYHQYITNSFIQQAINKFEHNLIAIGMFAPIAGGRQRIDFVFFPILTPTDFTPELFYNENVYHTLEPHHKIKVYHNIFIGLFFQKRITLKPQSPSLFFQADYYNTPSWDQRAVVVRFPPLVHNPGIGETSSFIPALNAIHFMSED